MCVCVECCCLLVVLFFATRVRARNVVRSAKSRVRAIAEVLVGQAEVLREKRRGRVEEHFGRRLRPVFGARSEPHRQERPKPGGKVGNRNLYTL